MAMQSGPLVGSNPGYFKRCGSEVAIIALTFLNEIVNLAGVNVATEKVTLETKMCTRETNNANYDATEDKVVDIIKDDECDLDSNLPVSDLGDLEIGSSSSSSVDESSRSGSCASLNDHEAFPSNQNMPSKSFKEEVVDTLQSAFLFSENQSMRICQWMKNAEKAVQANKAPSKSSKKLQDQKSKKKKMKELKMARKLKKKTKSGGK